MEIHAAARTNHIARIGKDAEFKMVSPPVKNQDEYTDLAHIPSSESKVPSINNVPVQNAYGISQILSWLTSQQETLQKVLQRIEDISELMKTLLRS